MTLDELFELEADDIDQILENAKINTEVAIWLEHDPDFLALVKQLEVIEQNVVSTYLSQGESEAFEAVKAHQNAIRAELADYVLQGLNRH